MSINNLKKLPGSGGRYLVSEYGIIYDHEKNEIQSHTREEREYVELTWINGKTEYEKGLIILSAFNKIVNIDDVFQCVCIIYKDGDYKNCFLENLTYIFSETIESSIPGFYLIPGFKNYALNRNGDVITFQTNHLKLWSFQKGKSLGTRKPGYKYCVLYENFNNITVYQHRLMCLVFKKLPDNIFKNLTVNHIDGNKSNNLLSNLEWITYSENLKHAWKNNLRFHKPKVLIRNLLTEEITSFKSLKECSNSFGEKTTFHIADRMKDQSGKIYPDYLLLKYDDGSDWPNINSQKIPIVKKNFRNDIVARNVFTGHKVIFSEACESRELFGIEPDIVLDHARNNKFIPYMGYNFRFLINADSWPEHTKRHLEIYKKTPKNAKDGFIAFDKETGDEQFFRTLKECLDTMGIAKAHLSTLIFTGRLFKKRYGFRTFKLKERRS